MDDQSTIQDLGTKITDRRRKQQGWLRRPVVCPMYTRRGAGQEDDKDGGVEQPGQDNQIESGGEKGGDPGGEIEDIEPMGRREVWPAKLFSLPD